jgi:hypothetical protein
LWDLPLLGRGDVDHSTVQGADPQGVVPDVDVAQDLAQIHPDDPAALDGSDLLLDPYLRGRPLGGFACDRLRRRDDRRAAVGTKAFPSG